ncbi:nitroreductase family deazaflavin-dependent oxidoreductase [Frankia sp. CNm7]|uniref:Nitroreductase family deazaflavin-dependent oxidoreductase n=1 Tax=Frankia nepalensis TaxID=1836974 RepID=A0A937REV2_9ACTN|nr:nitroreductase/quinone reductase family protein [Frankia nepalensis]MBL7497852.1 nitroreductase family deazaflavin-dependent oxidoreductase [Frankia nepalensis]MBL7509675.1 nitroreductase family deazaflavin-dependent oxidoreductase [Frankia nepalensis]MBL7520960.1 nitroreductase family deazaflavin-dependent oxidoreductase [Frankia nepalensis]MBL7630828.1 nitroreductase family deazaflavin-dependent oxidoreductase [Frankia nepalensis]
MNWNDTVIAEFRANNGNVSTGGFGRSLILLHTIGARSGTERVNPVLGRRSGDDWVVAASFAGAPTNPAWYHNLLAHPDVAIETGGGVVEVTATEITGPDYDREWEGFTTQSAAFSEYKAKAGSRRIPLLRLRRRA